MPMRLQFLPFVARVIYWGLRLSYPWITRILKALGIAYPELRNHFFLLQPVIQPTAPSDLTTLRIRVQNARSHSRASSSDVLHTNF